MRSPRCAPSFCAQEIHGTLKRSVRIIYRGAGWSMFCDGCGATGQTGQAFCSRCGKHTIGPVTAIQPRPGRVQAQVHLLGTLWLAVSAFNTIAGVILFILANTLFAHFNGMGPPEVPTAFLGPLLPGALLFL